MRREAAYHREYRTAMDAAWHACQRADTLAERQRHQACQQAYKDARVIARLARAARRPSYTAIDLDVVQAAIEAHAPHTSKRLSKTASVWRVPTRKLRPHTSAHAQPA